MSSDTGLVRVLIVDDDPLVLTSFRLYFSLTDDIRVVSEARNGVEALEVLDQRDIDVILADIHMPEMDGITLLNHLQKRPVSPAFVAITALDSDETMLKILALGGAGYIVKSARPREITAAVRDALQGGTTVSPQALSRLVEYIPKTSTFPSHSRTPSLDHLYEGLTEVERKVLAHLCDGLSNAEIAAAMNYSEITIKKHVSHLISYFNATSRLSLVVMIFQSGLNTDYR